MTKPAGSLNPVVPDTTKIAVEQTLGSAHVVNTFYCRFASPTPTDLTAMANACITNYNASLKPIFSSSWTLLQAVATDLSVVGGTQVTVASGIVGSLSDNPIPYQAAGLITWRTARTGKSYRGRTYLAGWTEAHSAGSAPDSAAVTAMDGFATGLFTDLNAVGLFVVVTRVERNPAPPPPSRYRATNDTTAITNHVTRPGWATQRRRATPE